MSHPSIASRRQFLRQLTALSSLGTAAPFALNLAAMGEAAAQTAPDYKALVCIFLLGGNDSYNTVIDTSASSWSAYAAVRNQLPESLVLDPATLQAITPLNTQGRTLALHPQLAQSRALFNNDRRLAVVSGVGPLIEPVTKVQYETKARRVPAKLFSHNDQQTTWQAMGPEGTALGWGGRIADMVAAGNGKAMFTAMSVAGNAVWLSGQTVRQYQVSTGGPVRFATQLNNVGVPVVYNSTDAAAALDQIVRMNAQQHVLAADLAAVAGRSIDAEKVLSAALPAESDARLGVSTDMNYLSPKTGQSTPNKLAQQLRMVARSIGARDTLGMKRQVFFVTLHGFDTHDNQLKNHGDLMAQLDHALKYFDNTLNLMGVRNQVTTFTASDFGRTFTSNGDGTDHGWGAHHFVMGGAVKGGDVYGALPQLGVKNTVDNNFDSSPDQLTNGVMLPKISVDQYGATLGKWFGLSNTQLNDVFRNLPNFSGKTDLGFLV